MWLLTDMASPLLYLPFVLVPAIHFGKAAAAYCHHTLEAADLHGVAAMLQLYILQNISPCYYL